MIEPCEFCGKSSAGGVAWHERLPVNGMKVTDETTLKDIEDFMANMPFKRHVACRACGLDKLKTTTTKRLAV